MRVRLTCPCHVPCRAALSDLGSVEHPANKIAAAEMTMVETVSSFHK